ncbi:DNA-processing protein DprA [Marinicella sp. S1101]|uniref:DNA-processing protein DprA n=1 Tax=Marinicella marina TaxID=2996016 RepID=UPI002260DC74|nr:DNA-processing protein DprA [Marinicella marina]MCX7554258.1 DNA-processing protein DprA [Marinicella marina]
MNNALAKELFDEKVVNPIEEIGAYESLWLEEKSSFKRIAELFNNSFTSNSSLPSDFVSSQKALERATKVLNVFEEKGIESFGVRIHGTADYSKKLRDARHPIELLYFRGIWELAEEEKSIAIVGSRKVSNDGISRTIKLVKMLVQEGYTIFSGLAEGVDTCAHETAIKLNGNTVAVIGTPICESYPKKNKLLQEYIAQNHLLISQVPVLKYYDQDWRINRFFFPERNKTMSAMTKATVIVEASETSGTLTQARAAIEQDRKLFILDSCFKNTNITWPAKFEKKGAIRVRKLSDILENIE